MNRRTIEIVLLVAALLVVAGAALGGYAVVRARAAGAEPRQLRAAVALPSAPPSAPATPQPRYERWTVGKAVGPVVVHTRPDPGAPVKIRLGKLNRNGYPTLVLVDEVRESRGLVWYRVYVAMRPNGSRGWVQEGWLAFFTTAAKIHIDLSERTLSVYRRGELLKTFPVAIGKPGLETPTGSFFIDQKLKPSSPGGPFGALAIGISAFQPKLADWPQGGPVAIHGTNRDELIGKAVSHGCVRMHDKDVLTVDRLVPAGSPVVITQ